MSATGQSILIITLIVISGIIAVIYFIANYCLGLNRRNSTLIKKFTFSGEDNNKLTFKFEMSSKNVVIDGGVYKSSALKNKFSHR